MAKQQFELKTIATQEQVNLLQPLIYNDPKLGETMNLNHEISRFTSGFISPGGLMLERRPYMEGELATMAGWVHQLDK